MTDRKRSKNVEGLEYIIVEGRIMPGLFFQQDFTVVEEFAAYLTDLNIEIYPLDFVNNMQDAVNSINK